MTSRDDLTVLLNACARDDHAAFEKLYILASPKLFAICKYMLRREDAAEDVLQEAFIQIWRNARTFDQRRASAMTWMTAITRHRALDRLRRKTPEITLDEDYELSALMNDETIDSALDWSRNKILVACIETLSDEQKMAIMLAFFHGLTHQELGVQLETPIGTVKSWIRRGLDRLKRCLET